MKVSLHTSALSAHAHTPIVLPWLRRAAQEAVRSRRPVAVVIPVRADAYFLKALALREEIPLFGVHFFTPSDVRDRLASHCGQIRRVPLREHSRLLLATAAERINERRADEALVAVAASPDQLLKAIDLIGGAGWDFADAGPARLRAVVADFRSLLDSAGFCLVHDADRALLGVVAKAPAAFAELLVIGFNALHWPHWPLLEAAVRSSDFATVCLTDPRQEGEDLDAAWVGTWEQAFGAAQPIATDPDPSPVGDLLRETGANRGFDTVEFLVGEDTLEQARAVVLQAMRYLALPECERVGILFPSAGALSRRVAALLAETGVPHHDGLSFQAPGPMEDPVWPAWLALQENPRLPALLHYLQAQSEGTFAGMPIPDAADELQRVFGELLLDDLSVMSDFLGKHSRRRHARELAAALESLPFLPEQAPLRDFIQHSDTVFRKLGWIERADELQRLSHDWKDAQTLDVSRKTWLRWLGETLVSWRTSRDPEGRHPYSRLHLLPYAQAESQSWSHLIATGLNEGQWPPTLEDTGLLNEEETDALNRRLRILNRQAVTQGSQGEGHEILQTGKTFCLGPNQRRALAARQFFNALESATQAVAVTAQLHEETAPDRPLNPGEFFLQLYFHTQGRAAGHDAMIALQKRTADWLLSGRLPVTEPTKSDSIRQTRVAYEERRRPERPFGEYEFALCLPPNPPLRLAAKRWEEALASPAEVWLSAVLGISATGGDNEPPWALAQGNWVHDWMRALAGACSSQELVALPPPSELLSRVQTAAQGFRDRVTTVLTSRSHVLPEWWISAWEQAYGITNALASSVAGVSGRSHAAVEWKLGEHSVAVPGGELHLHGRIDLLLTTGPTLEDTWLVDYKTGHRKPLRLFDVAAGDGVQLALYALALRAAGAGTVGLSLLPPGAPLERPQLSLDEIVTLEGLWRGIWRMQETGKFGMHGALREEFGYGGAYPLATLAIDEELLAEKWILTHPDFSSTEDDL